MCCYIAYGPIQGTWLPISSFDSDRKTNVRLKFTQCFFVLVKETPYIICVNQRKSCTNAHFPYF